MENIDKKQKDKVDELKRYILKNWYFFQDEKNNKLPNNIRGLGAMESNIDKVLANRFKKRGMRWSKKGARNLAKIIIADRNNSLENKLHKINWEFKTEGLKKIYNTVQRKKPISELEVLNRPMLALRGPKSGQDWVKGLKGISKPSKLFGNIIYKFYYYNKFQIKNDKFCSCEEKVSHNCLTQTPLEY